MGSNPLKETEIADTDLQGASSSQSRLCSAMLEKVSMKVKHSSLDKANMKNYTLVTKSLSVYKVTTSKKHSSSAWTF